MSEIELTFDIADGGVLDVSAVEKEQKKKRRRSSTKGKDIKLFHGTSYQMAEKIVEEGFIVSESGQLGRGVYLARREKAVRFAANERHGGEVGGLLCCVAKCVNPLYIRTSEQAGDWQGQGYDAVRTDETAASSNMEWCVKSPSQITVVGLETVTVDDDAVIIGEETPIAPIGELSVEALRRHDDTTERRQFNCPTHGTWFKKVRASKPVARCKRCSTDGQLVDAIPVEEERGRGQFTCAACGGRWASNAACRGLAQLCTADGCEASETKPHTIQPVPPRWYLQKKRRNKAMPTLDEHSESVAPRQRHWCTGCASGLCSKPPPVSAPHQSTGSTQASLSAGDTFSEAASSRSSMTAGSTASRRRRRHASKFVTKPSSDGSFVHVPPASSNSGPPSASSADSFIRL